MTTPRGGEIYILRAMLIIPVENVFYSLNIKRLLETQLHKLVA